MSAQCATQGYWRARHGAVATEFSWVCSCSCEEQIPAYFHMPGVQNLSLTEILDWLHHKHTGWTFGVYPWS